MIHLQKMMPALEQAFTGKYRVPLLLLFTFIVNLIHFALCPFPARDALAYLHILKFWNETGSYLQVLEQFPKFGLLLFPFLPVKWAGMLGIPMFPVSIIWMLLMSLVSAWTFYKIIFLLTGDIGKAMWCGAFLAASPMVLQYAGYLLRDTPYLMFCLLTVLCLICGIKERCRYAQLLSGVCLAMSLLSRFEAWEMLVLFPAVCIFYMIRNQFSVRESLLFAALAVSGFFCAIVLLFMYTGEPAFWYRKVTIILFTFLPGWMV